MLKYMLKYESTTSENFESITDMLNESLDISDRTMLQNQINNARKIQLDLVKMYDKLQGMLLEERSKLNIATRNLYKTISNRTEIARAMQTDLEIIEIQEHIEALQMSMKTVSNSLDIVKVDLRILTNSMYQKN